MVELELCEGAGMGDDGWGVSLPLACEQALCLGKIAKGLFTGYPTPASRSLTSIKVTSIRVPLARDLPVSQA